MPQQIHILNVRLPDDTIKWIDELVQQGVYNSRSEAIRDFLRDHMREVEK
jgi:putative addiction module CopG family antidote